MGVPTLPGIGAPPLVFFQTLELLNIATAMLFFLVSISVMLAVAVWLLYIGQNRWTWSGAGWANTIFLTVGRLLCVSTFPALFKTHKARTDDPRITRLFMVFLDRKVEKKTAIIVAFYCLVVAIYCAAVMVFLRYFPVAASGQCLERDNQDRSLFCYLKNASNTGANRPVDCAEYSVSQLQELHFSCYAISIPGLGIAVAAALGLSKLATVSITFYIQVTAAFIKMTKVHSCRGTERCLHGWREHDYIFCFVLFTQAVLLLIALAAEIIAVLFIVEYSDRRLSLVYYVAYGFLPILICLPLGYVVIKLEDHCEQGEFVSYAKEQEPHDTIQEQHPAVEEQRPPVGEHHYLLESSTTC